MIAKKYHLILTVLLIFVLGVNLLHVQVVRADGELPTEPPAATEVVTEPDAESTPEPPAATPAPEESQKAPIEAALTQLPESTEVVVLDEFGAAVPLGTQQAADLAEVIDPMWCPAGVQAGGPGCTTNFGSITQLVADMATNTSSYAQNGIIYFTATAGGSFVLTTSSIGNADFHTLNDYNITLQGGWNGLNQGAGFAINGQTDFGSNSITIGSTGSPWIGNVTLNDLVFTSPTAVAVTVYTTTGDIMLNNVDINEQQGTAYTAFLNSSTSGDITVQNSTFDGNASNQSRGLWATTNGAGQINISNTSFTDGHRNGTSNNSNGATLSAPVVTLSNIIATGNDGSGISISNANIATLNNVIASNNGTESGGAGLPGNSGSGVFFSGNVGSSLFILGGTFNNNQAYGVEISNSGNTTVYIRSNPACTGNDSNTAGVGCYNVPTVFDNTPPVITLASRTPANANGWNNTDVTVSWSCTDAASGPVSSSISQTLTAEGAGQSATGTCTDKAGNTASDTQSGINIDKIAPTISSHADEAVTTNNTLGTNVTYSLPSALDNFDASPSVTCSPVSGSLFSVGKTTVSCNATDQAGNPALLTTFVVNVTYSTLPPTVTPTATPASTATPMSLATEPSSRQNARQKQPQSSTESPALIVPITGGELIDLNCSSVFWAFGIKLSFMNFCDQQTTIHRVDTNNLPVQLPSGATFVTGVDVTVLDKGQPITEFPNGSGIEIDFPLSNQSVDTLAVLYWNGSAWTEVSKQIRPNEVSQMISSTAGDGLYQLAHSSGDLFHAILTAHKTGLFVLVTK